MKLLPLRAGQRSERRMRHPLRLGFEPLHFAAKIRQCGVPHHGTRLLHSNKKVGALVLDGLELADGPAELFAHLGVGRRRVEAPAGEADGFGPNPNVYVSDDGTASVTVNVEVYAERRPSDPKVVKVTEATLTYVAIDTNGRPRPVPR